MMDGVMGRGWMDGQMDSYTYRTVDEWIEGWEQIFLSEDDCGTWIDLQKDGQRNKWMNAVWREVQVK